MVARLRRQLDSRQYCQLPEFLMQPARSEEVGRVLRVLPRAHAANSLRNIYLERSTSPEMPADHPRNLLNSTSYRMVGAHLLPEDSSLKQLYHWPAFRRFVEGITGSGTLYPSADSYQPVNILCHGEGDRSAWHFDSDNAFTSTHQVTQVRGSRIRMMGVMVYESAPGVIGDPVVNATVYGV